MDCRKRTICSHQRASELNEPRGGYDVNGDVTPFTQQPVPQLDSSKWATANITDLWEQMSILNARFMAVAQMGKQEYMIPLRQAMAELQAVIEFRTQTNENKIT